MNLVDRYAACAIYFYYFFTKVKPNAEIFIRVSVLTQTKLPLALACLWFTEIGRNVSP